MFHRNELKMFVYFPYKWNIPDVNLVVNETCLYLDMALQTLRLFKGPFNVWNKPAFLHHPLLRDNEL